MQTSLPRSKEKMISYPFDEIHLPEHVACGEANKNAKLVKGRILYQGDCSKCQGQV